MLNSVRDVARGADGRRAFFQFLDWKIGSPHAPPVRCDGLGMGREQPRELRCATVETAPKGAVIHRHQLQENIEIRGGVIGRGKKRAEHDRAAQDQGLAALPIGPERRQRLPAPALRSL